MIEYFSCIVIKPESYDFLMPSTQSPFDMVITAAVVYFFEKDFNDLQK